MPKCGTQCWLCDLPIRFDTYEGCTHGCTYCFATQKYVSRARDNFERVSVNETAKNLLKFISGHRAPETRWCDWDIPLHWGGMSDPFQPCELIHGVSLECLKVLKDTQYPCVISTKGTSVLTRPEYLDALKGTNIVVQISMACSSYDDYEVGAPCFEDRLKALSKLSAIVPRTIVRIQPYIREHRQEIIKNLPRFRQAGAYGVIVEAIKRTKAVKGENLVRVGGDLTYPYSVIKEDFLRIKQEAHKAGLRVFAGENRIRSLGDNLTCCGIENLPGFVPNVFNLNHFVNGDITEPTEGMKQPKSGNCFRSTVANTIQGRFLQENSFAHNMGWYYKNHKNLVLTALGKKVD